MASYSLDNKTPVFDGDHWIAPSAAVIGNVRLGVDASVWFGAIVRGDNDQITIGDGSNIQDGCVLHVDAGQPLNIGRNCTIGHRAIIHACTIGDGTLIGMGATVLNRAVIGTGCLVGANALVTEDKVFPDHSLIVGAPARAIRTLDHAAVARILDSAAGYVANWKRYRGGLKPFIT